MNTVTAKPVNKKNKRLAIEHLMLMDNGNRGNETHMLRNDMGERVAGLI